MPYDFEAAGWSEFNQPDDVLWYEGKPSDQDVNPSDVEGIWVHAYLVDGDDEHWFWVRTYTSLDDWEQWLDLIGLTLEMHNMSMA